MASAERVVPSPFWTRGLELLHLATPSVGNWQTHARLTMTTLHARSFYTSLADGDYGVAELPFLKDQWERGEIPRREPRLPAAAPTPAEP
jgi:hypothetical protein